MISPEKEVATAQLGLQHKYGVVCFRGTTRFTCEHTLLFQSDDAIEAMKTLEKMAVLLDAEHDLMLVANDTRMQI